MKKILLDRFDLPNGIGIENVIYVDYKDEYLCGYIMGVNSEGVMLSYCACTTIVDHVADMNDSIEAAIEADNLSKEQKKSKGFTIADLEPIIHKDPGTPHKPYPWDECNTIPLKKTDGMPCTTTYVDKAKVRPKPDTGTETRVGP